MTSSQGKRIAVFSMTPLFPDFAMGGGQVQLKKVALHLGELGHRLTILSTRHAESIAPFSWHENVHIKPILRFKQPYPEPYFTPLYHIANAMRAVGDAIAQADFHYSHDGGLIFPCVYRDKPAIISMRSIIYPETLQSALLFQGDEWILPSEHTRASYAAVVSQFAPDVETRMHAIHNGFDWQKFRYTKPDAIFDVIPKTIAERPVLLFPHRPDLNKGIYEVIKVARRLVYDYGWSDLRVLTPRGLDAETEAGARAYYQQLRQEIGSTGLTDNFYFHDWIREDLIAEYYSIADVTMCIGNCVETFGNTPFESLGCGTPPILSRVSTYRDLFSEEHVDRVDYGDIDGAAEQAHAILSEKRRTSPATLHYLKSEFSLETMVTRYADVILNAQKKPPLRYRLPTLGANTRYRKAPWCYLSERFGIYHDFRASYNEDNLLVSTLRANPDGFAGKSVDSATLHDWLDNGYIVPLVNA
ncbi:MAG: glycosyltransferase family 4 protein [Chloroflexota bacterium]|nr:glycosyltransferase family 4 protein [Chloroflexota bacterium]